MNITSRRSVLTGGLALSAACAFATRSFAATPQVYAEGGVAVDGSDVVAYFTQGAPVAGDPAITHSWNGATWRFATEENRAAFAANPDAYAPQYGGYCAYAVSEGYTAATDPNAWTIVDGKLYLNYSRSVRALWSARRARRISDADANWPNVLQ